MSRRYEMAAEMVSAALMLTIATVTVVMVWRLLS